MNNTRNDLELEIDKALKSLAQEVGKKVAKEIRSILFINLDRGRLQVFLDGEISRIDNYVQLVANQYSQLSYFINQLQVERSAEVWASLYERMQAWAYNFFLRKGFRADTETFEIANECASDAATIALNAHFPYDTEFDPWAHVIVQNACRKYIHRTLKKSAVPEEKLINIDDSPVISNTPLLEDQALQQDSQNELVNALAQLSDARRTVIEAIYFDELTPEEIAMRMGKTVGAIYSLQFHALQDLRKILSTKNLESK